MRLIGKPILEAFYKKHPDATSAIQSICAELESATWANSQELKRQYRTASILNSKFVVFNISGNKYRMLVVINYQLGIVKVNKIGKHNEYNSWNLK